jgi:alpha-1,2-mannosyltransferase
MLLLFALAHALVRGPVDVKGNVNLCDYANHYSAARLWLIGQNPYDNAALTIAWRASAPGPFDAPMDYWYGLLPPGAFVALAPLAALPAWAATLAWLALSAGAVAACVFVALALANVRPNSLNAWVLTGAALAAAPFQTLVAVGQVSLFAVALILLAIWCAQRGKSAHAGVLLAVAASFKPQLAAPFGLFYLCYRNWKLIGYAAVTGLLLNGIGVAQLEWRGVNWWSGWTANIAASTRPGEANDPTMAGRWRHQIVSLTVLLHSFTTSKVLVTLLNATFAAALVGAYAWLTRRARFSADALLSIATLCAVGLLPVYHRSYDAALLIVPLAWALSSLRGPLRAPAWATLGALAVFLVPFDALMLAEQKLGMFRGVSQSWWWKALVAPHHAWALLAVCLCLIGALYLRVRQLGVVYDTDEQPDVIRLHAYQRGAETESRWRTSRDTVARRTREAG